MKIVSHRATLLPAVPASLARAIHESAERHGETAAQAIKRLLCIALAIEDEQPRPKRVFERIDTGVINGG